MQSQKPWLEEPNELDFTISNFKCKIKRNHYKALCGYVSLPQGHKLVGESYNSKVLENIRVHGGLTYSGYVDGSWTLGFDCAHGGDYVPGLEELTQYGLGHWQDPNTYKTIDYVKEQLINLVRQLSNI
jgi:hypothetical protein